MSRIDLENAIMKAWQTADDLDLFFHHHGDHPTPMTEDEVANTLLGLKLLHEMRMESLWKEFKKVYKLDEYCEDPEVLALRARMLERLNEDTPEPKKKGKKNVQKA